MHSTKNVFCVLRSRFMWPALSFINAISRSCYWFDGAESKGRKKERKRRRRKRRKRKSSFIRARAEKPRPNVCQPPLNDPLFIDHLSATLEVLLDGIIPFFIQRVSILNPTIITCLKYRSVFCWFPLFIIQLTQNLMDHKSCLNQNQFLDCGFLS